MDNANDNNSFVENNGFNWSFYTVHSMIVYFNDRVNCVNCKQISQLAKFKSQICYLVHLNSGKFNVCSIVL